MRAVVQRIDSAAVHIDGREHARIGRGLLVYLGVANADSQSDVQYLADKVAHLRVFTDADGKMNLDVSQVDGQVLVVSAFTVQADARRGRRPSFDAAAAHDQAEPLVEQFCQALQASGLTVKTGVFRAHMVVESRNDGPICILIDSQRSF